MSGKSVEAERVGMQDIPGEETKFRIECDPMNFVSDLKQIPGTN